MSENYYILLGLDPAVDDWAIIEATINEHERRWRQDKGPMNPLPKRRTADRNLSLISKMRTALSDAGQRHAIAQEADKQLKELNADQISKLQGIISTLTESSVDAEVVKVFSRQTGISEAEVVEHLKASGIGVAAVGSSKNASKKRPKLDDVSANHIRVLLQGFGHESLYDFLNLPSQSSPKSLFDAAERIYKEIKGIDRRSTDRNQLAGLGMQVFKDGEQKKLYDNTYASETAKNKKTMEELASYLDVAGAVGKGVLYTQQIDKLVLKAREMGLHQDSAIELIEEHARKRKWQVQPTSELLSSKLKRCGFCNTIARTVNDKKCLSCGQDLVQPCPSCGEPTPTQDECCGRCGCSTGDAPLVQGLLREGKEHVAQGDLLRAQSCFDRALIYWENWQPALDGKRQLDVARCARETALNAVDGLLRSRKLEEAQGALDRLGREFGSAGTEGLGRRIEEGIARARDAFRVAENLRETCKGEDAVEKFTEALGYCADFQPALRALEASPPPAPSGISVTMVGGSAQLAWDAVRIRGAVTYRVQRKASGTPSGLGDGITVGEFQAATCHDPEVPPGTPWYYAVFTVRSGVASAGAASSGPHLLLVDPTDVVVEGGDSQVSLRWSRPPGCISVEVWRESGLPAAAGRGTRVVVSADSAVDQGLKNGVSYGYLLVACFTDPKDGRSVVRSTGIGFTAIPVAPPPAVEDLRARREDRSVILTWTAPARGDVQIRQTRQVPSFSSGRIIPLSIADQFGVPVPVTGRGSTQVTLDGRGRMFFIPLSIVAQTAVLGLATSVTALDEVTNLEAQRHGETIHLTWTWPTDATQARVGWRHDMYPESPDDEEGVRTEVTRSEYERNGFWVLQNVRRTRHYFTVFVRDPDAEIFSTGANVMDASGLEAQVTYRVVARRSLFSRAIQEAWVDLRTKDEIQSLPALHVVLKTGLPPIRPEDGRTIVSLERLAFQDGAARINLPANGATGYVKLFFRDGRHAREVRLLPADKEHLSLG